MAMDGDSVGRFHYHVTFLAPKPFNFYEGEKNGDKGERKKKEN